MKHLREWQIYARFKQRRSNIWITGVLVGKPMHGNEEYKVSMMQDELSCRDLIYNMVTIVNNYCIAEILKTTF